MSSEGSDKKFYKLVQEKRRTSNAPLQFLCVGGKVLESPENICDGWSIHFGSLATPLEMDHLDNDTKINYLEDIEHILHICRDSNMVIDLISIREVQTALKKLKSNKAAGCMDITCEHLTYGGTPAIHFLTDMINYIFECKQGDRSDPANYRGITVTTVFLKVIEHVLNIRHNAILDASQSRLQKGFTSGRSSIDAALILSECIDEFKNKRKPLIVATLDAQKAFDVVNHKLLLRRLFLAGITGADWMLLRNMHTDLTSVVKWEGTLSSPFVIKQ